MCKSGKLCCSVGLIGQPVGWLQVFFGAPCRPPVLRHWDKCRPQMSTVLGATSAGRCGKGRQVAIKVPPGRTDWMQTGRKPARLTRAWAGPAQEPSLAKRREGKCESVGSLRFINV